MEGPQDPGRRRLEDRPAEGTRGPRLPRPGRRSLPPGDGHRPPGARAALRLPHKAQRQPRVRRLHRLGRDGAHRDPRPAGSPTAATATSPPAAGRTACPPCGRTSGTGCASLAGRSRPSSSDRPARSGGPSPGSWPGCRAASSGRDPDAAIRRSMRPRSKWQNRQAASPDTPNRSRYRPRCPGGRRGLATTAGIAKIVQEARIINATPSLTCRV